MKFLIVIPAHNEEENILLCLESLKNQTFQDFKCVIINDGSIDKTQEIVEDFIKSVTLSGVEALFPAFLIQVSGDVHLCNALLY